MRIVIDIPEDIRVAICQMGLLRIPDEMQKKVDKAIQHGTPLPKNHGRLIDADKLRPYEFERNYIHIDELDNAKTIIEADKE